MLSTARKTLALFEDGLRRRAAVLIAVAAASSLLETAGVGMIFVLFAVIQGTTGGVALPRALRVVLGDSLSDPKTVVAACALLFAVLSLKTMASVATAWLKSTLLMRTHAAMAGRLMLTYLTRPLSYHLGVNSSDLVYTTINSTYIVTHSCVGSLVDLVIDLLTTSMIVALLFLTMPLTTGAAILGLLAAGTIYWWLVRDRIARWGMVVNERLATMQKVAVQAFQGIKTIKVFNREASFVARFDWNLADYGRYVRRNSLAMQLPRQALELGLAAVLLGALAIVALTGSPPAGIVPQLTLLGAAAYRIMPALIRLSGSVQNLKFGDAALAQVYEVLSTSRPQAAERATNRSARHLARAIEFVDVSYSYAGVDRSPALSSISCEVRRGEMTAFTGESGSGKTTLVDILLGLLKPTSGVLKLDDVVYVDTASLPRTLFGYVPQDTFVIDDTLRRNVALGLPDREIDDARVMAALTDAALGSFLASSADGLDTEMGDRGMRISGGQRQRLGIARALYHDPDILVFDEPTSALDPATEQAIAATIDQLRGRKTIVIVTHRLSTVRGADRVYHLSRGRIVDSGSVDELLQRNYEFREMVDRAHASPSNAANA